MKLAYDAYEPKTSRTVKCPIILLHSLLESRKTWRAIGHSLAQRTERKVYAVDARNHGNSPWTDEYSYDLMADDLNEFLQDHGVPKIVLIGHSMGGKAAIEFTIKYPNKVEKLVIEDVPVENFKQRSTNLAPLGVKLVKRMFDEIKEKNSKQEADQLTRELIKPFAEYLVATPEMIDSYDFSLLPVNWNGTSYDLELNLQVIGDALFTGKLHHNTSGKYDKPTLFLFGKSSPLKVDRDKLVKKVFPSSTLIGIEGVGHFIHQTVPEMFLKEVVRFVNRQNGIESKY